MYMIREILPNISAKQIAVSMSKPFRFFLDEEQNVRQRSHALFGRMLHHAELVALCGGDSRKTDMTVGTVQAGLYLEYRHVSSDCVGSCLIYREADTRLALINEHVRFLRRNRIEREKFQWFTRQKNACESLGISAIHITGARSSISEGYYFYPLFGFNASLPQEFIRFLPDELSPCQTLLSLYEHFSGRKIWFRYGYPCDMVFELHGGFNQSQRTYEQYKK